MHVQACIHICGGQLKCHSQALPTLFYSFEIRVLIGLELTNRVRWRGSKPRDWLASVSPVLGLQARTLCLAFYSFHMGSGRQTQDLIPYRQSYFPSPLIIF